MRLTQRGFEFLSVWLTSFLDPRKGQVSIAFKGVELLSVFLTSLLGPGKGRFLLFFNKWCPSKDSINLDLTTLRCRREVEKNRCDRGRDV